MAPLATPSPTETVKSLQRWTVDQTLGRGFSKVAFILDTLLFTNGSINIHVLDALVRYSRGDSFISIQVKNTKTD